MISSSTEQGNCLVKAGTDLTIYTAADNAAHLRQALQAGTDVVLDLSSVEEIDTAGLQLLIQFRRDIIQAGREVRFLSPSPAIQDIVQLLNLHVFFDLPPVESAGCAVSEAGA